MGVFILATPTDYDTATSCSTGRRSSSELRSQKSNNIGPDRVTGIEPALSAWKAEVIATIPHPNTRSDFDILYCTPSHHICQINVP